MEKTAHSAEIRFRLLRAGSVPATNPLNRAYQFGLQDIRQVIVPGERRPDGAIVFDFSLTAKIGGERDRPVFTGRFASGPAGDRFVYLSWRAVDGGDYINRVKARLATIDWTLVRASRDQGRPVTADMTGWKPGDPRKHVDWFLGERLMPDAEEPCR